MYYDRKNVEKETEEKKINQIFFFINKSAHHGQMRATLLF